MTHDPDEGCCFCPLNVPGGHETPYCLGGAGDLVWSGKAPPDCPLWHGGRVVVQAGKGE